MTNVASDTLLSYKDKHFGKFFLKKPISLTEIKNNFLNENIKNFTYSWERDSPFYGIYTHMFYELAPGCERMKLHRPIKLPIILQGKYFIEHKLTSHKIEMYELLCIFPSELNLPSNLKVFEFYGKPEWFEVFKTSEMQLSDLFKAYKKTYLNKKY